MPQKSKIAAIATELFQPVEYALLTDYFGAPRPECAKRIDIGLVYVVIINGTYTLFHMVRACCASYGRKPATVQRHCGKAQRLAAKATRLQNSRGSTLNLISSIVAVQT